METLIILLHILIAVAIIAFVLLQQGKGAEAGASFGAGASQTLFGSAGSWNFFSRVTAILALLFFLTSFGLALLAKNKAGSAGALTPELRMIEEAGSAGGEVPRVTEGGEIPADVPQAPNTPKPADDIPEVDSKGSGVDAAGAAKP
ncbi:MAG: hypothetical protein AMXMBFR26_16300 [Porticoccaceae bacterium]